MKCNRRCKIGTYSTFGMMVLLAISPLNIINDFGNDDSQISEIIETGEAEAMSETPFFDGWQAGNHHKDNIWQGMGYIVTPSSEVPAPATNNWWGDSEESKHHSVDDTPEPTESTPATSISPITETEVKKLVFGEVANALVPGLLSAGIRQGAEKIENLAVVSAPENPVAPLAVNEILVPLPEVEKVLNFENSGSKEWMTYPEGSGKFNLNSLPEESSGIPSWMTSLDSLDNKRTPEEESPDWMKSTLEYLPTRSWAS